MSKLLIDKDGKKYFPIERIKQPKKCPVCNSTHYKLGYCRKCGYTNKLKKDIKP